jgi:alkanesulfonate monooxygenase SsuD/methylene tetrahydromethanopterin reductase-like flavin-dependent oxidoreductase (luciferase family)
LKLSTSSLLHIAVALDGAGSHPGAAAEPNAPGVKVLTARHWVDQVAHAERGLFDLVTIEDSHRLPSTPCTAVSTGSDAGSGRLDAIMVACRVAPVTRHIGIVAMASTTLTEPFLLSTQIATLDYVSHGRAGWQVDVLTDPRAAGYVGPRAVPAADARFAEAADHVEIVRRLWDSWDDDAEIRDAATNRFIDRERVHYIDYEAPGLRIRGPSITPRPPQGQPIVATLVDGEATRQLAASSSDVAFLAAPDVKGLRSEADALRTAAAAAERDPAQLRLLADVDVVLDSDRGAARERRARLAARTRKQPGAAPTRLDFTGSSAELAERLIEWSEAGIDGFRLRPATVAHDLPAIAGSLSDELQARGVLRTTYRQATLRGLLGLGRPTTRYAIA